MQKLDSSQTPDTKTVGLTVGVLTRFLEDNPKLLEEKNYKSIADKAIDGLLANKETGDALRNAARDKAKSEYSSASSLLEKGTKLTLVTTLQNDAMANKLIKEKLVGIVTPLLENGGVKALSEAMKPKDLKVSSLVEPSQSIKLAYAEMPKTLDQFVPSGSGQSTSAGTVRG